MASLGLTPELIVTGNLADDFSIIAQPFLPGRNPSWGDFRRCHQPIAGVVRKTHASRALQDVMPQVRTENYGDLGLEAVGSVRRKWNAIKSLVSKVRSYVDEALAQLEEDARGFTGGGLVASHNDVCSANWLISPDETIYLVDFDMMSLDDPAHDLGSILR